MSNQGIRAGRAYVEIGAKDKLTKGLRIAKAKLQAFASGAQRIGAAMSGIGLVGAAALAPTLKAASDVQETMNKFNVVFGENSKAVKNWSDGFAKDVGRSKNQISDFMASSQDLFVPLGFEPGAAESMSKEITGLAVDLASFNNKADGDTLRDLQAALTGSGEVMKKYGVLVNEAAVKQQLLAESIDPKTATDQQKVMARMSIILKGTTAAQGDAVRSAGSFANMGKRLKGQFHDISAAIGGAVLPVLEKFMQTASPIVSIVGDWISKNQGLVAGVVIGTGVIGGLGAALFGIGTVLAIAIPAVGAIATAIGAIATPAGLAVAAFAAIGAGLAAGTVYFLKYTEAGKQLSSFVTTVFGQLKVVALDTFKGISDALQAGDLALAGQVALAGLRLAFTTGLNSIIGPYEGWLNGLITGMTSVANTISSVFFNMIRGVLSAINSAMSSIAGLVPFGSELLNSISAVGSAAVNVAESKVKQGIGVVSSGAKITLGAALDVEGASADFKNAIAEAAKAREAVAKAASVKAEQFKGPSSNSVKEASSGPNGAVGGFNASVLTRLGIGSEKKEELSVAKESRKYLERISRNIEGSNGLTFG